MFFQFGSEEAFGSLNRELFWKKDGLQGGNQGLQFF
jgi:hypothetical protein